MGDDKLSAQAATDAKLREAQKKQGASGSGNGKIDVGKHLIMGSPDKSLNKPSIAELARPAFEKAKAEEPSIAELAFDQEKAIEIQKMERLRNAGDGKPTYESSHARQIESQKIAQRDFNRHLRRWVIRNQHLGEDKMQAKIDDFCNKTVEVSANGELITREQQIVRDRSNQLLDQFSLEQERLKQEAHTAKTTAGWAYKKFGVYGNQFE